MKRLISLSLVAAVLVFPALSGVWLLDADTWTTGAHRVAFAEQDRRPLELLENCLLPYTFVDDGELFMICESGEPGLIRVKPSSGSGQLVPLPKWHLLEAVAVSAEGHIAIAHRDRGVTISTLINGRVEHTPIEEPTGVIKALAWNDDTLDLVFAPDDHLMTIARLSGRTVTRDHVTRPPDVDGYLSCGVERREGSWAAIALAGERTLWVDERGFQRESPFSRVTCLEWNDQRVDLGMMRDFRSRIDEPTLASQLDGRRIKLTRPNGWVRDKAPWFNVVRGPTRSSVSAVYTWHNPRARDVHRILQWGERFLLLQMDGEELVVSELDRAGRQRKQRRLVRTANDLSFLASTLVPRAAGGFFLVDHAGRYITVDKDLARVDPLPLKEHIMTGGSRSERDPTLLWALYAMFGGLPLILFAALVFVLRRPDDALATGFTLQRASLCIVVIYGVLGGLALAILAPAMN